MTDHVLTEINDGVLRIALNRPEKKNALTAAMYEALAQALSHAEQDRAIAAVFIHGAPGVFTSGNDLRDFLDHPPKGLDAPVFRFLRNIMTLDKPIVAGVTGPAVGIGTTLLLHCDYIVAGESASFALPFVNLGLCPEAGSSVVLPLVIGRARAAQMLLFGEAIPAATACAWGLVNAVVPDEEVYGLALKRVQTLAAKPRAALRASKLLLKRGAEAAGQALVDEARHFSVLLESPEAREAMSAFMEKRPPDFARAREQAESRK